jgi:hypothetical protein
MVKGVAIELGRLDENEQEKGEPRKHVLMKWVERLLEEVTEGYDDQDDPEGKQSWPDPQAEKKQSSGDEFYDRNRNAGGP